MGFEDIAKIVGIPSAMLVIALLSGAKGIWRWAREVVREERATEHEREERLKAEAERDRWQRIAWSALTEGHMAATQTASVLDTLDKRSVP